MVQMFFFMMMMHEDMEALYRIKNETCFTSNYEKQLGLII